MQGPPVLHTLPSSVQEPVEASSKDGVAMELGVPAARPHQPSLAAPTGTTTMKPTGECWGWQSLRVCGQAEDSWHRPPWGGFSCFVSSSDHSGSSGEPGDLPQQGPVTCAKAVSEPAQDTAANDVST